LPTERVVKGTQLDIPEFGLTTAVVFTADNGKLDGLVVRLQDQARQKARVAAQWSHSLAEVELEKIGKVYAELEKLGHSLPDGQKLLDQSKNFLQSCVTHWNNGNYTDSYWEAQRALRPVRILMRACWEEAVKDLDSPVSSPYAVGFFTLPRHWRFMQQVRQNQPAANVLQDGDFELALNHKAEAWQSQEETLDNVEMIARRVTESPKEGQQCLMLQIKARTTLDRDGKPLPPPEALERTYLAIRSPDVRLQPGTLVQVSGWVRIPSPIAASADGVLLFDSAGGEPLAVRITGEIKKWKRFTLYRRVPSSGLLNVTVALTGLGTAYFDDIRIEPLVTARSAKR
jgi:hypothetical protein